MRQYSSNLVFVDLLFNMLVGFVSLFILAFLLINPVAEDGKIDPQTEFMITMDWDPESLSDIDIHILGPNGERVSYFRKEDGFIVLDRDDLGTSNDTYVVDDEVRIVKKNKEVVNFNAIVPGEYVINIHYFGAGVNVVREKNQTGEIVVDKSPVDVTIEVSDMTPFHIAYTGTKTVEYRQELTVVSFVVSEEGRIEDIRTDINIPFRSNRGNGIILENDDRTR